MNNLDRILCQPVDTTTATVPARQFGHRPRSSVVAVAVALASLALTGTACDDGSSPPAAGTPDAGATGQFYPCDVLAVLRAKCHTCHTMPPRNGAPMSLLTWAATQNLTSDSATVKVWQRAREYVSSGYMPYMGSPTGPLTATEKATLLAWLDAGAQPAAQACADDPGAPDAGASDAP